MALRVISQKFTGKADDEGWSQVYEFIPEDPEKLAKQGHLFAVVSTKIKNKDINAIYKGREILSEIHREYFEKEGESVLKRLKNSVSGVIGKYGQEGLEVGLLVILGETLYLALGGGTEVYLFRQGAFLPLLSSNPGSVLSASGIIYQNDSLLLGTSSFFKNFGGGVLKASVASKGIEGLSDIFTPLVQARQNAGDIALVALNFSEEATFAAKPPSGGLIRPKENLKVFADAAQKFKGVFNKALYVRTGKTDEDKYHVRGTYNMKEQHAKGEIQHSTEPYASDELHRSRKVSATVGILLLFLLLVSIFFGIRQKKISDYKRSYQEELLSAEHGLEESVNLLTLNPERSRSLFVDAREKVLGLSSRNIDDPKVDELREKIEKAQGRILGEYRENPKLFIDMGLLTDGFSGDQIVLTQGLIYVLDAQSKRIIKIDISTKRSEVVAGPTKVEDADSIAAYVDNVYVINSEGVVKVSDEKMQVLEKTWQEPVLPFSYSGNFYLLEKPTSKIWRYPGAEGKFGSGKDWLGENSEADLSKAISWAIDGNIWVLSSDRKVSKFSLGNIQQFRLDLDSVTAFNPEYIYTGDETAYLYFLDKGEKRIKVFEKDGKYKAQYIADEIGNSSQLVVSEKDKKIILLNDAKLFYIEITHL